MKQLWKKFEEECFCYLQNTYRNTSFEYYGSSDSTVSDIKAVYNNFFIEVKSNISQCGQFVVLKTGNVFKYSNRNKTPINKYSDYIINFMNQYFYDFDNAGTSGTDINIDKEIFASWIIDYYKTKSTKYFITKGYDYIIIPLKKIGIYFDITACYRVKKSGSSDPSLKNQNEIIEVLGNNGVIFKFENYGRKFFIITESNLENKIKINDNYYQFSKIDRNKYNVRKLSNTNNANVIFSIKLIKNYQESEDLKRFLEDLYS